MAFQDKKREWIEIFFFTRSPGGHSVSQWAISKMHPPRNPRSEIQGNPRRAFAQPRARPRGTVPPLGVPTEVTGRQRMRR